MESREPRFFLRGSFVDGNMKIQPHACRGYFKRTKADFAKLPKWKKDLAFPFHDASDMSKQRDLLYLRISDWTLPWRGVNLYIAGVYWSSK